MRFLKYSGRRRITKSPIILRKITGESMVPALRPGRIIVAVAWPVRLKQGDVIIFSHDGIEKVKRIHALQDGRLTVIGDNKFRSIDSRHFGDISFDDVIAKVVLPAS